jgi:3-methyladenine DNA glycosylase AlkD
MDELIERLRVILIRQSDETTRISGQRFFKEEVKLYGIKSATVRKIGGDYFKEIKSLRGEQIYGYCEALFQSGILEEAAVACQWSYFLRKEFSPDDFKRFENWIGLYISNWAICDMFCNHTMGAFLVKFPEFLTHLETWTRSENRWMRRASAVSLIIPARQGMFIEEVFKIAGLMISDRDNMVQKGYGWMLKSASQAHQKEVYDFVQAHKRLMPRTALRYAIEKMPEGLRKLAMEK